jgi:hypothetical protein
VSDQARRRRRRDAGAPLTDVRTQLHVMEGQPDVAAPIGSIMVVIAESPRRRRHG